MWTKTHTQAHKEKGMSRGECQTWQCDCPCGYHHKRDWFRQNHEWMLNPGAIQWRAGPLYGLKVHPYKLLISCKEKIITLYTGGRNPSAWWILTLQEEWQTSQPPDGTVHQTHCSVLPRTHKPAPVSKKLQTLQSEETSRFKKWETLSLKLAMALKMGEGYGMFQRF